MTQDGNETNSPSLELALAQISDSDIDLAALYGKLTRKAM